MKIVQIIFILCILLIFACQDDNNNTAEPEVGIRLGNLAPDFITNDIDNRLVQLSQFKNKKVVLLHFWATWCPYSRNSIDNVKSLWNKYNNRNFQIISISRDYDTNALRNFISQYSLSWIHIHDSKYDVNQHYEVQIIPMCYLIDKNGIIKFANSPIDNSLDPLINKLTK